MTDKVEALRALFEEARPEEWSQIPDIDLYMDQVISYMKRQHIGLEIGREETLTPAMINNYIKSGLLPRAHGKKYDRTHIGYLTAICLLKQVVSVREAGKLLEHELDGEEIPDFYDRYRELVDREYGRVAGQLRDCGSREEIAKKALDLAVSSYAEMLACRELIGLLEAEEPARRSKK